MIDTLKRASQRLAFLKPALFLLGSLSLFILVAEIFYEISPEDDDALMIPAIVMVLWCLIGYLALNLFSTVPTSAANEASFLIRLKRRFLRAFYYGLASLFLLLTITAAYMSYKVLGIYLS